MNAATFKVSPAQERVLIALVALVQFVNMLDFVMVMPLGPDFAQALGIATSHIGLVGGSYSFAAALVGFLASPFLDLFPRKSALLVCLAGVVLATLATTQVWGLESMLMARMLAGMFGGQMMALSQAMIADFVPEERRGRAMGMAAGGFAAASVVGIPFGLELSNHFGWQAPFFVAGLAGALVWVVALLKLPARPALAVSAPFGQHLRRMGQLLKSRHVLASYAMMALTMGSGFMIAPNISGHFQLNLGYPRDDLDLLYMAGGAVSFFSLRLGGYVVDKYSATTAVSMFTALMLATLMGGFVMLALPAAPVPMLLVGVIFVGYMVSMSGRNICCNALSSKVPPADERGLYMSLQSTVTNLAAGLGAYASSLLLQEGGGRLLHVQSLGLVTIGIGVLVPFVVAYVEKKYRSGKITAEFVEPV